MFTICMVSHSTVSLSEHRNISTADSGGLTATSKVGFHHQKRHLARGASRDTSPRSHARSIFYEDHASFRLHLLTSVAPWWFGRLSVRRI